MKRLATNFVALVSSEVARKVLGFFSVAYLARRLTLSDFGLVSLCFTILSYSINIGTAGFNLYGVKEAAANRDENLPGTLLSLRLLVASVLFGLVALLAFLVAQDITTVKLIIVFNVSLFAYALLLEWHFQGREQMVTVSFGKTITATIYLALILLIVRSDSDIFWVAIAAVSGDFAMTLFYFWRYRSGGRRIHLRIDTTAWKGIIRQSFPLGGGVVIGQISINLAPLVIAVLMTKADIGLYSAASKLVVFLLMLDRVFGVLLLPATARLQSTSPDRLVERFGDALRWILIVALPICVGGMLVSDDIVRLVYGQNFEMAAGLFRVLIWFLCFTMIHTVFTSGLVAVAPAKVYGRVMSMSAGFYLLAVVILTKFYGLYGTVFAVVISEGITLLIARRNLKPYLLVKSGLPIHWIILALAVMTAAVMELGPYHVFVRVLTGAVLYAGIILAFRVCTLREVTGLFWRRTA
jgi:O-antigen/teichoic acid export membrane protein